MTGKKWILAAGEAFAVFSIFYFAPTGDWMRFGLAGVAVLLLLLPSVAERLFQRELRLPVYALCIVYALGSMLGHTYRFYFMFPWWDKELHLTGGILFALVGIEIAERTIGTGRNIWFRVLFGICFSMAVSMIWEFYEYIVEALFRLDMQNDTVIHSIVSYELGPEDGVATVLDNIHKVEIDGVPLKIDGYLDIGLHDTMQDMLVQSFGAILAGLAYQFSRGRFSLFYQRKSCRGDSSC